MVGMLQQAAQQDPVVAQILQKVQALTMQAGQENPQGRPVPVTASGMALPALPTGGGGAQSNGVGH